MPLMLISGVFVSTTHATTYYVSVDGNDANAGTNWVTAKASIGAALSLAETGDRVLVGPGEYERDPLTYLKISQSVSLVSVCGPKSTIINVKH